MQMMMVPLKSNENQTAAEQTGEQKEQQWWQRQRVWLFIALVLGVVSIIVFLLTEDLSLKMGLVDRWTIVNAILFVVEFVAIILVFKHKKTATATTGNTSDRESSSFST